MRNVVILLIVFALAGCVPPGGLQRPQPEPKPEPFSPGTAFHDASVSVTQKKYAKAAAAFQKIITQAPGSALAAGALYEIALIHALQDNPQKDYARATHTFQEFLKRYPDNDRAIEARNWIAVIRIVQELKMENDRLNTSIEELKQLDIRHEERRGQ